jgi:hypothetical protein
MKKIALLIAASFIGVVLYAQADGPKPDKYSSVVWHKVSVVDYKPGKEVEAKKIIAKFQSAAVTAGTAVPVEHWFETGKYDIMVIWELKEDPADLEWTWSPDGVEWWKALVAQEGSEEAARKVQDDYNSLIASSTTNIARRSN